MKNAMSEVLKVLLLGVVAALFGHFLTGCDGGVDSGEVDSGEVDSGRTSMDGRIGPEMGSLGRDDAGQISCPIPSPTGDQPSGYGVARDVPSNNFILVTNDVRAACEQWKSSVSPGLSLDSAQAAGVDCADPARDFQGTTGVPWAVVATDPDGSTCSANATGGSCEATSFWIMPRYQSSDPERRWYVRSWALCSPSGQFVGWLYTTS